MNSFPVHWGRGEVVGDICYFCSCQVVVSSLEEKVEIVIRRRRRTGRKQTIICFCFPGAMYDLCYGKVTSVTQSDSCAFEIIIWIYCICTTVMYVLGKSFLSREPFSQ